VQVSIGKRTWEIWAWAGRGMVGPWKVIRAGFPFPDGVWVEFCGETGWVTLMFVVMVLFPTVTRRVMIPAPRFPGGIRYGKVGDKRSEGCPAGLEGVGWPWQVAELELLKEAADLGLAAGEVLGSGDSAAVCEGPGVGQFGLVDGLVFFLQDAGCACCCRCRGYVCRGDDGTGCGEQEEGGWS
jgi:hypothetical protein